MTISKYVKWKSLLQNGKSWNPTSCAHGHPLQCARSACPKNLAFYVSSFSILLGEKFSCKKVHQLRTVLAVRLVRKRLQLRTGNFLDSLGPAICWGQFFKSVKWKSLLIWKWNVWISKNLSPLPSITMRSVCMSKKLGFFMFHHSQFNTFFAFSLSLLVLKSH